MQLDSTHIDDLCDLEELTQETILNSLTGRYIQNRIFTNIGLTLLAINPYKSLDQLFSTQKLDLIKNSIIKGVPHREPHIYMLAGRAFQGMLNKQQKQAIIISGESGAGKTESAKYCMKMLTHFSEEHEKGRQHPVQQKLLACNPILEAFGNSKTVRNDNSSRFGKYLQIYFDAKQTIRGANIRSYLLQKTRVTHVAQGERNFHIFYSLCAALGKDPKHYNFLKQSSCLTVNGINETDSYQQIRKAMDDLCFPKEEQNQIQRLLLTVLELGNLQFSDAQHEKDANRPCEVTDISALNEIAKTLGISSQALTEAMVKSKLVMPKQIILISLDKVQCSLNRNTLCKSIYNCIFEAIIMHINDALTPDHKFQRNYQSFTHKHRKEQLPLTAFQINILDIFGFQNFAQNSLEQLCINYTNEKLLNIYNTSVFQNEMQQLREDEIDVQSFTAPSSESKIILLEEVFKIVKEKTIIKQYKDEDIISAFRTNRQNSQHIRTIQYNKLNDKNFLIKHSPVDISYSVVGFKTKNQDKVSQNIQNITKKLFPALKAQNQAKTLLEKFTNDINKLTKQLSQAQNHYVRCIKPNDQKKNQVNVEFMRRQIRYLGVFQTIKIRKSIYPYRKTYAQFIEIYKQAFKGIQADTDREKVERILKEVKASSDKYMLGHKRIYLSSEVQEALNLRIFELAKLKQQMANKIMKAYKKIKNRQRMRKLIEKVVSIIKILKKWAKKAEDQRKELMFCGMIFIKEEADNKQNEQTLVQLMSRIENSAENRLINRQQKNIDRLQDWDPLQTICRLRSLHFKQQNDEKYEKIQDNHSKQKIKELKREIETHQLQKEELNIQLIQQRTQIQKRQTKFSDLQTKYQLSQNELQRLNQSQKRNNIELKQLKVTKKNLQKQIEKWKNQYQIQKEKNNMIALKLDQLRLEKEELNHQFQSQMLNNTNAENQRSILESKLKDLNSLKNEIRAKDLKVIELEQQISKLNIQIDEIKSRNQNMQQENLIKQKREEQSSKRLKDLQQMVISLQKINEEYKNEKNLLYHTKDSLNEKLYEKVKELQDMKKKQAELQNKEKMRNVNKEAIENLKLKVNFLQSQNTKLKKAAKDLDFQINQLRIVNQKLREKVSEQQKTGSEITSSNIYNERVPQLSEKELLQQLISLKMSMNSNQLRNLRNKIASCLS